MAELNAEKIKKYRLGEAIGTAALIFCAAVLVYFVAMFAVSRAQDDALLQIVTWATSAPLMVIGVAIAAYCNLKYTNGVNRIIKKYATEVFIENVAAMHPERNSLSYFIDVVDNSVVITVNDYKEKIVFDFSAFGKFTLSRKADTLAIITDKLTSTFCLMYERGANHFKSVNYRIKDGTGRNSGKTIPVIVNGAPDKHAMKIFLRSK